LAAAVPKNASSQPLITSLEQGAAVRPQIIAAERADNAGIELVGVPLGGSLEER
jgi:hypothetical protein